MPNKDEICAWKHCSQMVDQIQKSMPAFFPRHIDDDKKFHELTDEDVMPIYHTSTGPNDPKKELGRGAYGKVWEVGVDPTQTFLSGVRRKSAINHIAID